MDKIKFLYSDEPGKVPALESMGQKDVAINTADGKMFLKRSHDGIDSLVTLRAPDYLLGGAAGQIPVKSSSDDLAIDWVSPGAIEELRGPQGDPGSNAYQVVIESSEGTIFRPGQGSTTILSARIFSGSTEVTDQFPESYFRWTRKSVIPRSPPYDDATWNANYVNGGYKHVLISVDDVQARATFFCSIIQP